MKKILFFFLVLFCTTDTVQLIAQQLPDFSQYPALLFQINPAFSGTKSNIDARLSYRKQWTGFEGQPTTQLAAVSSRLWKGRVGVAGTLYKDVTGPTSRKNYGLNAAYHLHFPDVEFSIGLGVNFNKYTLDGTQMTTHWTGDPTVNYTIVDYDKNNNVMAGILLYNDRFHFGLSVINLKNAKAEFYQDDTTRRSVVKFTQHYYFNVGYNFNGNPEFVWENSLQVLYVVSSPMTINYNLRVHYQEKVEMGLGWRMKDALYVQAGYTFFHQFQFIYSYDIGISHLRKGHQGSHEFMLGYRWDLYHKKGGYGGFGDFQHQRYHIF